ncbi:histidine phosphatase family protein [Glycomyces xiaoerkulensis]|uniref:hypothetical protein n=1 Tax=Glycomyces xiaoerkulensis TaxID=2038139 RepID=UPI0012FFECC3|nr:hypothetical protein [Glycomyces xiaoerkulensis]
MPMLEIRRHSKRDSPEAVHLSQAGVELARWAGTMLGPFETVACSVAPRTRETAIAMGFAADRELATLPNIRQFMAESAAAADDVGAPFTRLARLVGRPGPVQDYSKAMAAQWQDLMVPLGPGDAALVIGHGGHMECALVSLFPEADHDRWGALFGYMEGARLHFDSEAARFHDVDMVRM